MGDHDLVPQLQLALEMVCWALAFEPGESEELTAVRQAELVDNAKEQALHELKARGLI
jgi:hypothetical protein